MDHYAKRILEKTRLQCHLSNPTGPQKKRRVFWALRVTYIRSSCVWTGRTWWRGSQRCLLCFVPLTDQTKERMCTIEERCFSRTIRLETPLKSSVWTPAPTIFWSKPVLTLWVLWQLQSFWFVQIRLKCVLLCGLHRIHTGADPKSTRDSTVPAVNRQTQLCACGRALKTAMPSCFGEAFLMSYLNIHAWIYFFIHSSLVVVVYLAFNLFQHSFDGLFG